MVLHAFPAEAQERVEEEGRDPSGQHVDGVVGLDIHRGEAHQYVEGQQHDQQRLIAGAPGKKYQDGRDTDVAAGEGGGGSFAGGMGTGHQLVAHPIVPPGNGQRLVVGHEVVVHVGEHAVGDVVESGCQVVVLRPTDGQQDEDDVVDEERAEDDECGAVELVVSIEEVPERHQGNQWIIGGIAQVHQFAEDGMGEGL